MPDARQNQYRSERGRELAARSYDAILARWPVPYRAGFVETRFGLTHVVSCGPERAPPLVLLHGLGTNATSWFKLMPALSTRHRVHAIDTIGDYGKSAGTRPPWRSGDHARWLDETLGRLDLVKARLVGLSAGGWIALQLAITRPARVHRLALLAPASLQRMRPAMMLRGAIGTLFDRPAVIRGLLRYLAAQDAPVMPEWAMEDAILRWRAGKPNDLRIPPVSDASLASLQVPTLLMLGSDDPIYDAGEAAERVRAVAPEIRIEILPGAGHLFPSQHPEATARRLLEFFAE